MRPTLRQAVRRIGGLALAIVAALALAACPGGGSGGADDSYGETEDAATTAHSIGVATEPALASADEGGYDGSGTGAASVLGRTIIRDGYIALRVESVEAAFERVRGLASTHGGYVADSSFSGDPDPEGEDDDGRYEYAHLTLRIPADRYDRVVDDLRALALGVLTISTNTRDVTGEVTDLESDLRNLRAVESQYLELLARADEVGDVVLVHDRLSQTRGQIERIEGSLALLRSLADLSTLRVELHAPPPDEERDGGSVLDAARDGWEASLATLEAIARAVLAAAAFSWWLVPIVVVAAVLYRRRFLIRRER